MNDDAGFGGSFGRYGGDKRGRNMSGGSDGGFGGGRNEGGNRRSSSSFSGSNWGSDGGDFGSANSQREVQNRYKNSSADDIFGGKY
ncbi:hypothetical protein IWQ60_011441 [Tieghemiomyces parasiticus]|uniref:Uncharacterized protein n=1 Tax=Tieghemiomyces parasiticus TaxID=78921 RepID=A0A9W8DMA3_9FUNG|nr:hypothetical protein IWQ60_011441 [Tieghemiomyces parasiticus]